MLIVYIFFRYSNLEYLSPNSFKCYLYPVLSALRLIYKTSMLFRAQTDLARTANTCWISRFGRATLILCKWEILHQKEVNGSWTFARHIWLKLSGFPVSGFTHSRFFEVPSMRRALLGFSLSRIEDMRTLGSLANITKYVRGINAYSHTNIFCYVSIETSKTEHFKNELLI